MGPMMEEIFNYQEVPLDPRFQDLKKNQPHGSLISMLILTLVRPQMGLDRSLLAVLTLSYIYCRLKPTQADYLYQKERWFIKQRQIWQHTPM